MAETDSSLYVGPQHLGGRFITLDECYSRLPLPGDTLTDLKKGEMNEVELIAAKSIGRIDPAKPPAFLNKAIGHAVAPTNFKGDLDSGFASIFEGESHEVGKAVNVVYGFTLIPSYNRQPAAAVKVQYRPLPVSEGITTVERELIRLELEAEELDAFRDLEEQPSQEAYRVVITGLRRAINASGPFSEPKLLNVIRTKF